MGTLPETRGLSPLPVLHQRENRYRRLMDGKLMDGKLMDGKLMDGKLMDGKLLSGAENFFEFHDG